MNESLSLFKLLADDTRLKLLCALAEKEQYVELLAEKLQLSAPTVSFHMKKLLSAGLVSARREQYYIVYSLNRELLDVTLSSLIFKDQQDGAAKIREEMYRGKVIKAFMPNGYCEVMPAQIKKRQIIYEEIFKRFEKGRLYQEKEVNEIIAAVHADYCTVRRTLIGMGWMKRENNIYSVVEETEESI